MAEQHILILEDEQQERPAFIAFMQGLRAGLAPTGAPVLYLENLDLARFPAPAHLQRHTEWLLAKYRDVHIDIVIAGGPGSMALALRERPVLFPGTPIVFVGEDGARPQGENLTGMSPGLNTSAALRAAVALLPKTRQVALVSDAIDNLNYQRSLREDIKTLPRGVELVLLEGLPIDELKRRVAALPADSLVFYARQVRDTAGRKYGPGEILDAVLTASSVPVFGQLSWMLGRGIVGGQLVDPQELGRKIAELVLRISAGESASAIPVQTETSYPAVFDARQLGRWHIDRALLPAGSKVLFEPVSLWAEHRGMVIGVGAALLLQSALIGALLWEQRRRRRAELDLRQRTQQIAMLNRAAALGEVSAAIAHELNQPLGSILLNAETANRLLEVDPTALAEAREILGDIRRDGRRANAVVEKVRQLFTSAAIDAQRNNLNRVGRDVVAIAEADPRFSGFVFDLDLAPGLPAVSGDRVQLHQVLFNLVTNAADAILSSTSSPRRIGLRTRLLTEPLPHQVELAVLDSGPGLEPGNLEKVFEPFFSSKATGMGIGLAISRSIASAHGGSLKVENRAEGGACFRLVLPALPT